MNLDNKQSELGAGADHPAEMSWTAWRAILGRVWINSGRHHLGLMAGGVAFFAFLSFVPLLGALLMAYGIFADPAIVAKHMRTIINLVPTEAAKLIYDQLVTLTTAATSKKGTGLLIALAVSIFGATRASGGMMSALNVVYEQEDRRSLIRSTGLSIALIISAIVIGILGVLAASVLGYVRDLIHGVSPVMEMIIRISTWVIAFGVTNATIAAMYRFAPDRHDAKWRWLSVGAVIATVLWLAVTMAFGVYAASFGGYDVTYGSLSAIVVLLMWLYLSAYAILLGALINAEAERQTSVDTTTGPPLPIGARGATMADMSVAARD